MQARRSPGTARAWWMIRRDNEGREMTTQNVSTGLLEATVTPLAVADEVESIAEEAMQAAFKVIADRMELVGFPVTGDIAPDEAFKLDQLFQGFVLGMALNNPKIAAMQETEV